LAFSVSYLAECTVEDGLDRDYLTVPVDEIRDIAPVMTVMDGRVVYEAR
jgi:predicted amidohydrolase YtcJ